MSNKQRTSKTPKNAEWNMTSIPTAPAVRGKSVISHERKKAWEAKPTDRLDAALADAMLGSETALLDIAHENSLAFKWGHLNRGMQRMNLGNVLRGRLRREERVSVLGTELR